MFEVSTTSFDTNVDERRLVAERAKFAKHVMVSAGVCFGGKGKLHFIPDKTKVNAKLYVETLLPELVQDCRSVCHLASSFNRTARLHTRQSWLKTGTAVKSMVKMNGFRTRLTSTRLTTMSEELSLCLNATSHSNPTSMSSRKFCSWYGTSCCQGLDQESHIELPEKTSGLCDSWWWILRTYAKMNYLSDFSICNNSQSFLTMKITSCCCLFRTKLKLWHRIFI